MLLFQGPTFSFHYYFSPQIRNISSTQFHIFSYQTKEKQLRKASAASTVIDQTEAMTPKEKKKKIQIVCNFI